MRRVGIIFTLVFVLYAANAQEFMLRFGLFADCQSAQTDDSRRRYTLSPSKLSQAIDTFNVQRVMFQISLGDLVNSDIESLEQLVPILDKASQATYHVVGNHDVLPTPRYRVEQVMQLKNPYYYSVVKNGVKLLFLDSNTMDTKQISWVSEELDSAKENGVIVVVFSHHPLYYLFDVGVAKHSKLIRDMMEQSGVVKACFSGHVHIGGQFEINGIHYMTLKGMVETENNRFAIVEIYPDRIEIDGYGDEKDNTLKFIKK